MNPVFNNIAAQISCLNKIEGKKSESAWKLSTNTFQSIKQKKKEASLWKST